MDGQRNRPKPICPFWVVGGGLVGGRGEVGVSEFFLL